MPTTVAQALKLDEQNGNTYWQDAIEKEIGALMKLNCFEFHPKDFIPTQDYQKTKLMMVFDVKNDLRRKARLVAQGQLVDILDHVIYSSTCKHISIRLLTVIAQKSNLKILCGDIGNAYVNATTNEKVYCKAGLEFGPKYKDQIVIIKKALYGLASSSERWHTTLANTLRSDGWHPTRYDRDVWIRLHKPSKTYEYVCTYVDDFMIFSRNPDSIMAWFKSKFQIKGDGSPEYYLGNDYKKTPNDLWSVGCKKYIKDALAKVQDIHGNIEKRNNPCDADIHLECDTTPLLDLKEHRQYQQLVGILNWVMQIGRIDIAYAAVSLAFL